MGGAVRWWAATSTCMTWRSIPRASPSNRSMISYRRTQHWFLCSKCRVARTRSSAGSPASLDVLSDAFPELTRLFGLPRLHAPDHHDGVGASTAALGAAELQILQRH